jgi:site-specific recombinase XerC
VAAAAGKPGRRETTGCGSARRPIPSPPSLSERCDRTLRLKTAREWRRIFEHDVAAGAIARSSEITKADVLELVNDKAARRERKRKDLTEGAAVQAGKMLTRLRTFFSWAADNDLVGADPTAGVRRPAKEASRDRVLGGSDNADLIAVDVRHLHPLLLDRQLREADRSASPGRRPALVGVGEDGV